jgi:hypothetical protein
LHPHCHTFWSLELSIGKMHLQTFCYLGLDKKKSKIMNKLIVVWTKHTLHTKLVSNLIHKMSQPYFEGVWGWNSHSQTWTWESSRTPKISEFDCRGQNTSHSGVLYIIGKLAKCKCRKWPRMGHFDICSTSHGKKKGKESNWQFDSRPLKVENRHDPGACRSSAIHRWKALEESYKFASTSSQLEVWTRSYDLAKSWESKSRQFRDSSLGVPGQKTIQIWVPWRGTKYTIWGKVVASPESGLWWVMWV